MRSASTSTHRRSRPSVTKRESGSRSRRSATTRSPRSSSRSANHEPTKPCAPVTRTLSGCSAARDGREDRHLVAVLDRRVEPLEEANVLAAYVYVHEAAQVSVLGDAVAQPVVAVVEAVEHLTDRGRAIDHRLGVAARDD